MGKSHMDWSLSAQDWDALKTSKVSKDVLKIVKTASIVDANALAHGEALKKTFRDDPVFLKAINSWANKKKAHCEVLLKWVHHVDPSFDFERSYARFCDLVRKGAGRPDKTSTACPGDLLSRCIWEASSSSFYLLLHKRSKEPILKALAHRIALDDLRGYRMFYSHMSRYLETTHMSFLKRVSIAVKRMRAYDDLELASAYFSANTPPSALFSQKFYSRAYYGRVLPYYTPELVHRSVSLITRAVGLKSYQKWLVPFERLTWWLLARQGRHANPSSA
jgi:hypothetical protein